MRPTAHPSLRARAAALIALVVPVLTGAGDADLQWPVAMSPAISSNFCESRDGRFHGGIDVRSFGREGIPCRALGDGWISRVRASSRGYGKAIHLTLDSGRQAVYAHLSELAPVLEDTLWVEQMRETTFAVDFRPARDRFRVKAGEIIAYSGSTGASAPHLHLEVRDDSDAPINPLRHGLVVPDRLRPQITRLALLPLSPDARVAGRTWPLEVPARRSGEGRYTIADTLEIAGEVGVAVTVQDRINAESGRLAPWSMEVWNGDSLATRVELDRFTFDQRLEVDLLYHAGAWRARGIVLYQLFENGQAGGQWTFHNRGRLDVSPGGTRSGRVVATDAAGNHAELTFWYRVVAAGESGAVTASRLAVDLDGAYFSEAFAVIPRSATQQAPDDGDSAPVIFRATDASGGPRPLAAYSDKDSAAVFLAGLLSGADRRVALPTLGVVLDVPTSAIPRDVLIYAREVTNAVAPAGSELRSRAVRVGPVGWVPRSEFALRFAVADADSHDAVYRRSGAREWTFLASSIDTSAESAGINARSGRPGVFAVFRDETAPVLGRAVFAPFISRATGDSLPQVHVPIDDAGSGIDEARTRVRVDGVRHFFRWDFAGKKIIVPLASNSIIGTHSIRVEARDRAGNSAVLDTRFQQTGR